MFCRLFFQLKFSALVQSPSGVLFCISFSSWCQAAGMGSRHEAVQAAEPKLADVDARDSLCGECSCKLISGSPTEVSFQHPAFAHSLVVNTSAVSALALWGL